ncbi:MAG: hypothetical protein IKE66_10240 [Hyphomicrobium sp.]|nr:hypothetical protein [Hyphomicrobium sp.]
MSPTVRHYATAVAKPNDHCGGLNLKAAITDQMSFGRAFDLNCEPLGTFFSNSIHIVLLQHYAQFLKSLCQQYFVFVPTLGDKHRSAMTDVAGIGDRFGNRREATWQSASFRRSSHPSKAQPAIAE